LLTFAKVGATNILIRDPRGIAGLATEMARHSFSAITGYPLPCAAQQSRFRQARLLAIWRRSMTTVAAI